MASTCFRAAMALGHRLGLGLAGLGQVQARAPGPGSSLPVVGVCPWRTEHEGQRAGLPGGGGADVRMGGRRQPTVARPEATVGSDSLAAARRPRSWRAGPVPGWWRGGSRWRRASGRPSPTRSTGAGPCPGSATRRRGCWWWAWPPPPTAGTARGGCSPATARATGCSGALWRAGLRQPAHQRAAGRRAGADRRLRGGGGAVRAAGQQAHARGAGPLPCPTSSASWPCSTRRAGGGGPGPVRPRRGVRRWSGAGGPGPAFGHLAEAVLPGRPHPDRARSTPASRTPSPARSPSPPSTPCSPGPATLAAGPPIANCWGVRYTRLSPTPKSWVRERSARPAWGWAAGAGARRWPVGPALAAVDGRACAAGRWRRGRRRRDGLRSCRPASILTMISRPMSVRTMVSVQSLKAPMPPVEMSACSAAKSGHSLQPSRVQAWHSLSGTSW